MPAKSRKTTVREAAPTAPTTLDAVAAEAAKSPDDETVQLVYADALDETGDPADAAKATGIRATIAIRSIARAKMADLDAARESLADELLAGCRAASLEGVAENDPAYHVCRLVSQTLARSVWQPSVPDETAAIIDSAQRAELLGSMVGSLRIIKGSSYREGRGYVTDYSLDLPGDSAPGGLVKRLRLAREAADAYRRQNQSIL